jgi:DNA adenine methylase
MIHAPIKSYGGKGSNSMLKTIYSFFPENYNIMIEPFMGSMVVTLNNPVEKCAEFVNDLNLNIYSLYKVIQDEEQFYKLKEKLDLTCYHEQLFIDSKNALKTDLNELDRAYYFFIVNRMSFNGNNTSFGKNSSIRRNMSKSTSDFLSTIDGLEEIHKRLSKIVITNLNGLKLIEKFKDFDNTFFYLDPPYAHETRTSARYEIDFTPAQQIELVNLIKNAKAKFLLSGYDNELYENNLVKECNWNKYSYSVNTITGKHEPKTKTEMLWYNYENERLSSFYEEQAKIILNKELKENPYSYNFDLMN